MEKTQSVMPQVQVDDLWLDIDGTTILHGIRFEIGRGKTLGIVGESGSGKSMSALSIMRLLPPKSRITKGSVLFSSGDNQTDLCRADDRMMNSFRGRVISMVFQEPMTSLNPVKRCGEQVNEVLRHHRGMNTREARNECLRLFDEVWLPRPKSIYDSYPHEISGGQKQRVMIAQAIACNPDLLIADEPTTALDVTVQKSIIELLNTLRKKYSMSMIFITHDLALIRQVADDIIVMRHGRIVERGLADEILHQPQHPYTKGLLACRPKPGEHPYRLATVDDFLNPQKEVMPKQEAVPVSIPSSEGATLMEIRSLTTSFPLSKDFIGRPAAWLHAVDDVSLDVMKNETLGLVGESGCGKTTLGRTILRLQEATGGSVHFEGSDVLGLRGKALRDFRKRAQIIFQDPYSSLNPRMSAGNAIMEPMKALGLISSAEQRYQKSRDLMAQVGLEPDHFRKYPHEFSGGQRQRICIARALAVEPEFIVCDESVSALDVSVQAQVLNLLQDLKEEYKLTYIFISHDLAVVEYIADRIAVMNKGRIIELGPADIVFNNPQKDYTRTLVEAIPRLDQ